MNWFERHWLEQLNKSVTCDCYECVGSDTRYDDSGRRYTHNNMKYHTLLEPCSECGKPKTEYRDLGTKGYFECWWCNQRNGNVQIATA